MTDVVVDSSAWRVSNPQLFRSPYVRFEGRATAVPSALRYTPPHVVIVCATEAGDFRHE